MLALLTSDPLIAQDVDTSELPAPYSGKVDYRKDILPLFEAQCFRCHGPEKPKSGFRLDNRQSALESGDTGPDIFPGLSADSPLIHYVARLVPDMGMPPMGKGDPLTPHEIALLRAWIDQGVDYGGADAPDQSTLQLSVTTGVGYIGVEGNANKFRENSGVNDGWSGGVTEFKASGPIDGRTDFTVDGRIIGGESDTRLRFDLEREDWGAVRGGFQTRRRWSNDTGGYYPAFTPPVYALGSDLYVDEGRAWLDLIVERGELPYMRFGYEFRFREGNESTLQWGPVSPPVRNIHPAIKQVDEQTQIFKFDIAKDVGGWALADSFRFEWYDQNNIRINETAFNSAKPGPDKFTTVNETYRHTQGANTFTVEKWFTDWFMVDGGYLYSWLDGGASFDQSNFLTDNAALPPTTGFTQFGMFADRFWSSTSIVLDQNSHVGSLSTRIGPWQEFLLYGGVQADWMQQSGFSEVVQRFGSPTAPPIPVMNWSDIDRQLFEERAGLRYTGLPFSTIYAEGRWQQETVGQPENSTAASFGSRGTDADAELNQYRFGMSTSPWRPVLLSAHYQIAKKNNDYTPTADDDSNGPQGSGYPNFISGRQTDADEIEAKLVTRLASNLKASFTYEYVEADYQTTTRSLNNGTPAGTVNAANQNANIFSLGLNWTPWNRVGVNVTGSYANTDLTTFANDSPGVVPYAGNTWSVISSVLWTVDERTDFNLSYAWSDSNYQQDNFTDGLPLGIHYQWNQLRAGVTRKLSDSLRVNLFYLFQLYNEPSSDGFNDYTANGFFASLTWTWSQ